MLMSKGSLQVIMAIPAVRFRIIWCAATRIRDSSESSAKSFLTICSHVVMAILMDRSTTGWTSSCTARSIACRTHCFSWGWAWNSGIWRRVRKVTSEQYTRISPTLVTFFKPILTVLSQITYSVALLRSTCSYYNICSIILKLQHLPGFLPKLQLNTDW